MNNNGGGNPNHDPKDGRFTSGVAGAGRDFKKGAKMSNAAFVKAYAQLRKDAAIEFKAAFKAVGARMWGSDDAHPLNNRDLEGLHSMMEWEYKGGKSHVDFMGMPSPLLMLDSYPSVRNNRAKMSQLSSEVRSIWEKYNKQFKELKKAYKNSRS